MIWKDLEEKVCDRLWPAGRPSRAKRFSSPFPFRFSTNNGVPLPCPAGWSGIFVPRASSVEPSGWNFALKIRSARLNDLVK